MKSYVKKKMYLVILFLIVIVLQNLLSPVALAAISIKKDTRPPTAPSKLSAKSITQTSLSLSWKASKDIVGVKYYYIYKNGTYYAKTSSTTYKLKGLKTYKTYQFYVRAKDVAGNYSKKSNTLTIRTLKPKPTPTIVLDTNPINTLSTLPTMVPSKMIVGYYAAWATYLGFSPDKIDASKLTHINYAFANIGSDLKIALGYPDVDALNISKLNALKQGNPNLKTLISVGGWTWSGRFSDVALTDANRTIFADSCVDFIVNYGFDGVDIDWEYPVGGGLITNIRRPEDKSNFTLLVKKLREKLEARGVIDGKHYLLTFAGAVGNWYVNNTELGILHNYVDYANVMTYDIHGTWDKYCDFNAPLYNNSDTTFQFKWSVDSSINIWLNSGFPKEKIVMGVPFYGHIYKAVTNTNNGLYQLYSGGASISYMNIAANYLNTQGYTRYFHTQSMVPWLFNGSTFISYEDEQSMGLKAQYIKSKELGGAMIWELSQDPNRVLLNSLYQGLN